MKYTPKYEERDYAKWRKVGALGGMSKPMGHNADLIRRHLARTRADQSFGAFAVSVIRDLLRKGRFDPRVFGTTRKELDELEHIGNISVAMEHLASLRTNLDACSLLPLEIMIERGYIKWSWLGVTEKQIRRMERIAEVAQARRHLSSARQKRPDSWAYVNAINIITGRGTAIPFSEIGTSRSELEALSRR